MGPNDPVVAQLWRYPVKSIQGEPLAAGEVHADGLDGDRCWGVRDERTGRARTGRREPRLLEAAASLNEGAEPVTNFPTGPVSSRQSTRLTADCRAGWKARCPSSSSGARRSRRILRRRHRRRERGDRVDDAPERFVDASPLLILTTASLRAGAALHPAGEWDLRRFRPNLLFERPVTAGSKTRGADGSFASARRRSSRGSRASAARWSRGPSPASTETSSSTGPWLAITAAISASGPQYAPAAPSPRTTSRAACRRQTA